MNLSQGFKMAFASIFSNKMRSFLTMLGIIIGVFSVTVLVSLVQSATDSVEDSFSGMGTNLLTVNIMTRRNYDINTGDLEALADSDNIEAISPYASTQGTVKAGNENMDAMVEGITPQYFTIRNYAVAAGRSFIQNDLDRRFRVAVVGVDVADELFNTRDVVGETINVSGVEFTIIGVLEEQGSTMMGSDDEHIFVPLTTGQRLMRNTQIRTFYVSAASEDTIDAATDEIESFLKVKLRSDAESANSDYMIFSQSAMLDALKQSTGILASVLGGIAAISLLVGGIGIMNIMLVSVTERTREIGIRKSIGAKRRDILFQFLIEAIILCVLGGILGILLGAVGIKIASVLINMANTSSGASDPAFVASLSPNVVGLAVGFSILVGVVFGLYPANKASKLVPVEALRYE